jgi:hypothetical protein
MSNTNAPFGLRPVSHMNGMPWNGMVNIYYHSASDGTAIYRGDIVQADGTYYMTSGEYPAVKRHVADQEDNIGVVVAFGSTPQLAALNANLNAAQYCPASTEMYLAVVDDPDVLFEIQEDSDGGYVPATDIFGYGNVVATAGSSTTGLSGMVLDSSDVDHSGTATLQVMRLSNRPNNALGNYAVWVVRLNEHIARGDGNLVA